MGQGKVGWWIAGAAAVIVLISVGYGLGRRGNADPSNSLQGLPPAGAPLPSIQVEPIQPQQELAAISSTAAPAASKTASTTPTVPTPAAPVEAVSSIPLPTEESARIREVQKALKIAGFDPGPIDGRLGARTRSAVRDFQNANGLEADGKVGPRTWNKLETYLKSNATTTATGATPTPSSTSSND